MSAEIIHPPRFLHLPDRASSPPAPILLAWEMREAASDLASRIEGGEYDGISADGRCDLRALTLAIAGWADRLEELT